MPLEKNMCIFTASVDWPPVLLCYSSRKKLSTVLLAFLEYFFHSILSSTCYKWELVFLPDCGGSLLGSTSSLVSVR